MGCSSSREELSLLPSPGINIVHGQQALSRVTLKLKQLGPKECIKLAISPDSLEVKSRGRRLYIIARPLIKTDKNGQQLTSAGREAFRQQEIRDASGGRVLCLFARDWGTNITGCSCYAPPSQGSRSLRRLFTLKRGDKNNFWAEMTNPIQPARITRPFLDIPFDGGDLRYGDYKVGSFSDHELTVEANMDQTMIVALAMMTTALKSLGLYTKMLMYASPGGEGIGNALSSVGTEIDEDSRRHRRKRRDMSGSDSGYSSRSSSRSHSGLRNASQSYATSRSSTVRERSRSAGRASTRSDSDLMNIPESRKS